MHTKSSTDGEAQWTEEDWADLFSARLSKILQAKYPWLRNFGCSLATEEYQEGTGYVYQPELDLSYEYTHSYDFLRILHIQKQMGRPISNACSKTVEFGSLCR
jgi:hypothetical protein